MAVLVAYDGSEPAQDAVEHAFTTYPDEEVVLIRVVEAAEGSTGAGIKLAQEMFREREEKVAKELPKDIAELIGDPDREFRTETTVGDPAREIVSFADENDEIDHIIIGSHGREGLSRVLLGSVAEKIVRRSPVPVTVIR
ncbi:UspA domain-containing protein [Natrinema pellirubrum DSM 15624]|uniref:Universal stress protein UspA-like protein n=2 Tax=Natrinema TaxID=88723 RepID=L0JS58_NATP1|nr:MULTISPECIES: universal stress protein [Natrinema]ELZ16348.1 UspA domain-containing protein [Natrinema thermotolerans DSM 11552]AGB33467.1 universal stress protein UspA-like protein [Natrinema pellirubrum DSM 15624]ELY71156.1 UspA domain-containing protein [Natrinema pellirubrum DSM 15624]QCC58676.1 universal stress protein [Natrinema thermotolerans]WMT09826.1 universal stress protein [Natrinema thermotolerans]